ncbi:MAG: hypothetical protein V8R14_00695 [Clostridia bacterium]
MEMQRYDTINNKNSREIVLLRGSGCKWRRCRFCDYHLDFSRDEKANFEISREALSRRHRPIWCARSHQFRQASAISMMILSARSSGHAVP